jgi:hypothetical protein
MAMLPSGRKVKLIDARDPSHLMIEADLYRDVPAVYLDGIETQWATAREKVALAGKVAGLNTLEHAHWDWRNKFGSVESGRSLIAAVSYGLEFQGVMAIARTPRAASLSSQSVIYVDYLEIAPWNLKATSIAPRFLGVGTILLGEAVLLAQEDGHEGRVGLHSLPQAEGFYARCGMTRVGFDPDYYDLPYYEFTSQQATNWLITIGELR